MRKEWIVASVAFGIVLVAFVCLVAADFMECSNADNCLSDFVLGIVSELDNQDKSFFSGAGIRLARIKRKYAYCKFARGPVTWTQVDGIRHDKTYTGTVVCACPPEAFGVLRKPFSWGVLVDFRPIKGKTWACFRFKKLYGRRFDFLREIRR